MTGRDYIALRRCSTKGNVTLAAVGETCERVPSESLPLLLASGKIAPKPTRKPRADAAKDEA